MSSKTVIVTAASKGIGSACAKLFREKNFNVMIMSRSEEIFSFAEEIGAKAVIGDVTKDADLKNCIDKTLDHFQSIDTIVSNTGHPPKGDLLSLSDEDWHRGIDICLLNIIRIARYAVPIMKKQGSGTFVNISSFGAISPSLNFPISSALRSALSAFTKLFSDQYALDHIRMNSVLPGYVDSYPLAKEGIAEIPMQRQAKTDEIAKAVYFLASDDSSYINGQNLLVDGGLVKSI